MVKDGIFLGNRYEVIEKIGSGGMADVYKGRDTMLNRYVAIKVLKKEFREDETFVKKFRSEAQAAAGLLNPNIVNVSSTTWGRTGDSTIWSWSLWRASL